MKILFDFSVSYQTGALQRIRATLDYYDSRDGQYFLLHDSLRSIIPPQSRNWVCFRSPSLRERFTRRQRYIERVVIEIGTPDIFFSYGIPIKARHGFVNWMHISNALSLSTKNISIPMLLKLKMFVQRRQIRASVPNLDVISGESWATLELFDQNITSKDSIKRKRLTNGFVVKETQVPQALQSEIGDYAIAVGIQTYKRICKTFEVFCACQQQDSSLKRLIILASPADNIYNSKLIPKDVFSDERVVVLAPKERADVLSYLSGARVFISMSQIENSSNAVLEAATWCNRLLVSDIPAHREFVAEHCEFDEILLPGIDEYLLSSNVRRRRPSSITSWDECLHHFQDVIENLTLPEATQ